jgi:chromosome partitioning protein
MISIALISQKGGVGKTTLATAIAAYGAREGLRTLLIDMDPLNASAFRWAEERRKQPGPLPLVRPELAHSLLTFQRVLESARHEGVDLVIIDTPQGTGDLHFAACAGAHLVLVPCIPSFFDANAIVLTLQRAAKEQKSVYVVFTDVAASDKSDAVEATRLGLIAAAEAMGLPEPLFAPHLLRSDPEHRAAAALGRAATETAAPKTRAASDMRAIAKWAIAEAQAAAEQDRTAPSKIRSARERLDAMKGQS